jgi:putative redox protein
MTPDAPATRPSSEPSDGDASADWVTSRAGSSGFRTQITIGRHTIVADEPHDVGGGDEGPTPYQLLLGALGSCTAMTLRMYSTRKGWPLEEVIVRFRDSHTHAADCADCETRTVGLKGLDRHVELRGPLTDEQKKRLLLVADRCPVKQTLDRGLEIVTAAGSLTTSDR